MINKHEYERLKALRLNISYTQEEMDFMIRIARENIDEHIRVCTSCNSSIGEFKQRLFSWFLANEDKIVASFFQE